MGDVSYSIYPVHYAVLHFFMQRNLDSLITLDNVLGIAVINVLVIAMPLVLAISAASCHWIELAFLIRRTTGV